MTSTLNRENEIRDDIDALMSRWRTGHVLKVNWKGRLAVTPERELAWERTKGELPDDAIYLGSCESGDLFVLLTNSFNLHTASLRELLPKLDDTMKEAAAMAVSLAHWHSAANLCGVCGGPTHVTQAGTQRLCPNCHRERYPRMDPAVIMAIIDNEDRLLLARNSSWNTKKASLIAGFLEAGESLEQCVKREVFEEVGLIIDKIKYLGSQPWPFPRSIMAGFIAHTEHPELLVTSQEIVRAKWFTRAELRDYIARGDLVLPQKGSIAEKIISDWLEDLIDTDNW